MQPDESVSMLCHEVREQCGLAVSLVVVAFTVDILVSWTL